jgi:hypothetical protein
MDTGGKLRKLPREIPPSLGEDNKIIKSPTSLDFRELYVDPQLNFLEQKSFGRKK